MEKIAIRLNKYLAESGLCSRRQADDYIKQGHVFINGRKAVLGDLVNDADEVKVGTKKAAKPAAKVYLAYHKPVGVICTADTKSPNNIIRAVKYKERVFPVGRLDVATSGLIFLTNDGEWANRLAHPKYQHEKEYQVLLAKAVTPGFLKNLKQGVKLTEGLARADSVERLGDKEISLVLHQGWNRQVRRMCEEFGFAVVALQRIRIGSIKLANLQVGTWRNLTAEEVKSFL